MLGIQNSQYPVQETKVYLKKLIWCMRKRKTIFENKSLNFELGELFLSN